MKRITLDWDTKSEYWIGIFIKRILRKIRIYNIEITPTKKGYHCVIWTINKTPTFKYKNYFGNDEHQTKMDLKHKRGRQTLFYKKKQHKKKYLKEENNKIKNGN